MCSNEILHLIYTCGKEYDRLNPGNQIGKIVILNKRYYYFHGLDISTCLLDVFLPVS